MTAYATAFWIAAILFKGIAVFRLWRHRRLFPWLIVFLAAAVLRSTVLLVIRGEHAALYRSVMAATAPYMMAIETLAVLSIFWRLTEKYPNWRRAGSICLAATIAAGFGSAWLLRAVGVPAHWTAAWQAAYALQRHWMLGLGITLVLILRLVRATSSEWLPVRPIALRAAECLAVSIFGGTVTALLVLQAGTPTPAWAYAVGPLMGAINGLLCAFWLPRASAECGACAMPPDDSREAVRYGIAMLMRGMGEMRLVGHAPGHQWSHAPRSAVQFPRAKGA